MSKTMLGVVISIRLFGEKGLILQCLTDTNGMMSGFVNLPSDEKKRSRVIVSVSIGNLLSLCHYGREGSLGRFVFELKRSYSSIVMQDRLRLSITTGVCNMVTVLFGKNELCNCVENLFYRIVEFLDFLSSNTDNFRICATFIILVKFSLQEVGHGFSLDSCVATDEKNIDLLRYISPKSACAVSEIAGAKYSHLLLSLPRFFVTEDISDYKTSNDLADGLKIVDFFLKKFVREYSYNKSCIDLKNWIYTREVCMSYLTNVA